MPWNPTDIPSGILAVHAALMPTGAQGEVVLFGGDEHWEDQQESAGDDSWHKTRIYDVATRTIIPGQEQSPTSDVFCAHHVFTGDGRLLIAGGTSEWPDLVDGHDHGLDFLGHSRCWLYNPRQRTWVETTRLNRNPAQPNVARSGGRWYPGLVALGDGSVVAFFGHLDHDDSRHRNTLPERYFPGSRAWVNLPSVVGNYGEPDVDGRRFLFFMRGQVLPSGKIFSVTPMPATFDSTVEGGDGPHFSTAFDPDTGVYTTPRAATADGVNGDWSLPATMLPLLPAGGNYNARFLYWNGNQPRWIDTDAASPDWQNTGPRDPSMAGLTRIYGQSVILPTGQICAIGGVSHVGSGDGATDPEVPVGQVELYTPGIDWATNSYIGIGGWSVEPGSGIHARNYHSTALLLPNGQVWVAGGDHQGRSGNPDVVGVKRIELYEPPYIAIPGRIAIQNAPPLLGYGQEFAVEIDRPGSQVGRAALIRNGSVTHSTDNDQRYVGLEIVSTSGNTVRFRAPPSGNVAPPGYYMLWLMDAAGVPCQQARFIRVAHLSCRVIADRSTFSQEEVQAIGGGANANFASALYVDFDGFLAAELSGTPGWTLEWASDGTPIDIAEMRLQPAGRFDETSPPNPDVPTRITFAYNMIFPNMAVFDGWIDRREVIVRFALGSHRCSAVLELSKSANPYMIDVDPAVHNPDWLSTDVRVFKMRPSQSRFGATVTLAANSPYDFIRTVIDRMRNGTEDFEAIATEGPDTTLDGAYMSGTPMQPTFNFAVARVRYRATSTVAESVRCFFRLCNAAATGLQFDTNSVYRKTAGADPVPLLGIEGGQIVSIPFVNAQRRASVVGQPGAASMEDQPLDATYDIQNITPVASGDEVTVYFGVYLDINTPTPRFPVAPAGDGPFPAAGAQPIRDLLRSWHTCLVAEIVFDGDPTRAGATPSESDNLAQRNLAIIGLENPGLSASRTAMHAFEVRPSPIGKGHPLIDPTRPETGVSLAAGKRQVWPDELFFDWHDLPADTQVTLYFSDVDTAEIAAMLRSRISPPAFTVLDARTIRFKVADCAWLPLPGGRQVRIPALLSIGLPDGIVEGQVYRASIRQVDGRSGRIIGSVTLEMPVSKAPFLLPEAQRQLSFMGHVATTLPAGDRWVPIFERLLQHLAARVDALGGRSDRVEPNPDGTGKPYRPISWQQGDPFPLKGFGSGEEGGCSDHGAPEKCLQWPRWVIALAVAWLIILLALPVSPIGLGLGALAIIAFALAGTAWSRACGGRIACGLFDAILLGSVAATAVLAVALALGWPVKLLAIAIGGALAAASVLVSYLLRCRDRCCG